MAMLGLIGGPLQGITTLSEALWELRLGIYPIVWGFRVVPILSGTRVATA